MFSNHATGFPAFRRRLRKPAAGGAFFNFPALRVATPLGGSTGNFATENLPGFFQWQPGSEQRCLVDGISTTSAVWGGATCHHSV